MGKKMPAQARSPRSSSKTAEAVRVGAYRAPVDVPTDDPAMASTLRGAGPPDRPRPLNGLASAFAAVTGGRVTGNLNSSGSTRSPSTVADRKAPAETASAKAARLEKIARRFVDR